MELAHDYLEKFRPRISEKSAARSQRDELTDRFLNRLNADRTRDGIKAAYPRGKLLKAFQGIGEDQLHRLFQECSAPGVKRFGGLLAHKLKSATTADGQADQK